jgi:hypothetical protein
MMPTAARIFVSYAYEDDAREAEYERDLALGTR